MKSVRSHIFYLLLLTIIITAAGFGIAAAAKINILPSDLIILPSLFAFVTLTAMMIFTIGTRKQPGIQTVISLVALGVKFILEMILALVWFFVAKKTGATNVVLFFLLYLAFTLFLIFVILNTLKTKSL
ncbi:MAG TPA: hypothetical protein VK861_04910 [Bacteroidales bacterium]|nr:hypothetical protein [Bacteroidales bacterium]